MKSSVGQSIRARGNPVRFRVSPPDVVGLQARGTIPLGGPGPFSPLYGVRVFGGSGPLPVGSIFHSGPSHGLTLPDKKENARWAP